MKTLVMSILAFSLLSTAAAAQDDWESLPDPTRPVMARQAPAGGLALQSTFISPSRRVAVINGRTLGLGERVGDAVIADIRPYEVVLNKNGRETRLRMLPRLAKETTEDGSDDNLTD
jgi:MSHA biogenesis protein MshK